jgi:hypothetical protein
MGDGVVTSIFNVCQFSPLLSIPCQSSGLGGPIRLSSPCAHFSIALQRPAIVPKGQRSFGPAWLLQASYFGSHVSGADDSTYRNIPLLGPGAIGARRPNPLLSGFKAIRWDEWSIYHSGTFRVAKRLSRGLSINASYTWSKSIDDASDVGSTFSETNIPQNVSDVPAERAVSSVDHRHRFVFLYSYALPFGKDMRSIHRESPANLHKIGR